MRLGCVFGIAKMSLSGRLAANPSLRSKGPFLIYGRGARMVPLYAARIEDLGRTLRIRNDVIGPLSTPPSK